MMTENNTRDTAEGRLLEEVKDLFDDLAQKKQTDTVLSPATSVKADEELLPSSPLMPLILESPDESLSDPDEDALGFQPVHLIIPGYDEGEERFRLQDTEEPLHDLALDELPPRPRAHHRPVAAIGRAIAGNFFHRGDTAAAWGRKSAFWLSLLTLLLSLLYALYALWLLPMVNASRYDKAAALYRTQTAAGTVSDDTYPAGMRAAFCGLYDINPDVRGFVQYHATDSEDFLDVEYPIMRGDDIYLDHDFFGKANENGALFFDERNHLDTADGNNKVLFVYGQNALGGQMLSGLDRLAGSVYNARAATTMTVSTLYEQHTYQVFAVMLTDEDETGEGYFNARRTDFASEEDFLAYVAAVRERSLFDYPVEVTGADELLVLTTCASPSVSKLENGRIMVFARRVAENSYVNTAQITRNEDVIMPMAWYIGQGLTVHPYYETADSLAEHITESTSATETTVTTAADATVTETTDTTGIAATTTTAETTVRAATTTTRATTTTKAPTMTTTTTTTMTAEETTTTTTAEETTTTEATTTTTTEE